MLWVKLLIVFDKNTSLGYDAFGSFGSFFGGFIGTIVLIVTLYYAYKTYKDSQKNQIETRFFQLLKMVADTRNEQLEIDKDIFGIYIRYIGVFYKKIEDINKARESAAEKEGTNVKKWKKADVLKMAYLYFFYGIKDLDKSLYDGIGNIGIEGKEKEEEEKIEEIKAITNRLTDSGISFDNPAFKTIGGCKLNCVSISLSL